MNKKRILIIGGVAGGASAAARARRLSEDAEIILFERGEHISFANCGLPYHIGNVIEDRDALLVQTPEKMHNRFRIDVRTKHEVVAIDRQAKEITVLNLEKNEEYREKYDHLILSPGAAPFRPPIPGIDNHKVVTLRNMKDMDEIINIINEHNVRHALVVGGGYIGLEMAENLHHRNIGVTLVELLDQIMAPVDKEMAALLHQEIILNGIDLKLSNGVTEFKEENNKLTVTLSDKTSIATDLVILAIGVKPETLLAKEADIKLGETGGILVDQYMQTNDKNIYAVGDAVEIKDFVSQQAALIPLAGPANRQARIAIDHIFGRDSSYHMTQGTGICKVFGLTAGMTGLNEKTLRKKEIPFEKIYLHPANHAGYYPGATPISLKLLFDPKSGKILGAQAIGVNGVDKKIDVLAMAMRAGQTVFDLENAELCYAPPYGSAKDVVNYAGFIASNFIQGDMPIFYAENLNDITDNQIILDVRTKEEVAAGMIPNAINIPLDDLRNRLNELDQNKEIIAYCKVGLRGYLACRILMQNGFKCRNLTGGYTTYLMAYDKLNALILPKELHDDTGEMDEVIEAKHSKHNIVKYVDARGLACPGPIQKLREALDNIKSGEAVSILTTDPGFMADAPAWCNTTGNLVIGSQRKEHGYETIIAKSTHPDCYQSSNVSHNRNLTIVVFSNDFDKIMAALIIANGAASMGFKVTLFFTFWGLNVLRKSESVKVRKNIIEKMFGIMMPRGANKLILSKLNMLGMGTAMIKGIMRHHKVSSPAELLSSAQQAGIKLIACNMTMDLMGIKAEELVDNVSFAGVATYLDSAGAGGINLFI
ncbi:MAG: FAD-dependent oxidoreductase [Gammaproteobacteria bacterium]|nr:FAD-dependent oxidoreductase [Gammaproteobacteria bacterium]